MSVAGARRRRVGPEQCAIGTAEAVPFHKDLVAASHFAGFRQAGKRFRPERRPNGNPDRSPRITASPFRLPGEGPGILICGLRPTHRLLMRTAPDCCCWHADWSQRITRFRSLALFPIPPLWQVTLALDPVTRFPAQRREPASRLDQ
jgi:hypothetical protein